MVAAAGDQAALTPSMLVAFPFKGHGAYALTMLAAVLVIAIPFVVVALIRIALRTLAWARANRADGALALGLLPDWMTTGFDAWLDDASDAAGEAHDSALDSHDHGDGSHHGE